MSADAILKTNSIKINGRDVNGWIYVLGELITEHIKNMPEIEKKKLYEEKALTGNYDTFIDKELRAIVLNKLIQKNMIPAADYSLADIAYLLNVSAERVRQFTDSAEKKIKHPSNMDNFRYIRELIDKDSNITVVKTGMLHE